MEPSEWKPCKSLTYLKGTQINAKECPVSAERSITRAKIKKIQRNLREKKELAFKTEVFCRVECIFQSPVFFKGEIAFSKMLRGEQFFGGRSEKIKRQG